MEMSIDDVIRYIKDLRDARGCGYQQANVAIDAMRKYQKIQKIVKAWNDMNSFDSMLRISEVLEDGNDD